MSLTTDINLILSNQTIVNVLNPVNWAIGYGVFRGSKWLKSIELLKLEKTRELRLRNNDVETKFKLREDKIEKESNKESKIKIGKW